jgi:hypothetical protein
MIMSPMDCNGGPREAPLRTRIHHEDLLPQDLTTVAGIPVTAPARTLLDLATCVSDEDLELAVGRALARGLTTRSELFGVMARYPKHRGVARMKALLRA